MCFASMSRITTSWACSRVFQPPGIAIPRNSMWRALTLSSDETVTAAPDAGRSTTRWVALAFAGSAAIVPPA
jgi:hypothetical protein